MKEERYTIMSEVGRGAMGVVYLARDTMINREVAFKVLSLPPGVREKDHDELVSRFMREAQAAGRLSGHPNIVTTHDVGEQDGMHFIAMELVQGDSLTAFIEMGALPFPQVIDMMLQLCDAMDYAHSRGIIHRDLKPENIFVLPDGRVKVGDFGIARVLSKATVTEVGTIIGTPGYMSPEQVRGQEARPASDIFAAGVILYELLVGVNPFEYGLDEPTYASIIYAVVNDDPVPLYELDASVPPELDAIVSRAIRKEPADRYASFRHFLNDLTIMANAFPAYDFHTRRPLVSTELLAVQPRVFSEAKAHRLTLRRRPDEPLPDNIEEEPLLETAAPAVTGGLPVAAEPAPSPEGSEDEPLPSLAGEVAGEPVANAPETEEAPEQEPFEEQEIEPAPPPAVQAALQPEAPAVERAPAPAAASGFLRNKKVLAVAAAVILVVAGIATTLALTLAGKDTVTAVSVPPVVGLAEAEAESMIEKAGCRYACEYKADNEKEAGTVLEQSPKAKEQVKKGSKVSVIVAVAGKVDTPSLVNLTENEALITLQQNKLNHSRNELPVAEQAQHGRIISQDPAPGTKIDSGTTVAIVVANFQGTPATQPEAGRRVQKTRTVTCSRCGGAGFFSENYSVTENVTCPTCGGSGYVENPYVERCPTCGGSGSITQTVTKTRQVPCSLCGGAGSITETYWVEE